MDPDQLRAYYSHLFPFSLLHKWFSYNDDAYFLKREVACTLQNDIFRRHMCYESAEAMKRDIVAQNPLRLEFGAVFNQPPAHRTGFDVYLPVERELVFGISKRFSFADFKDIDMDAYNPVRPCCSEAAICPKCWPLMCAAVRVLDDVLRNDFGFKHLLWVYSGRRGMHCWVADKRARVLTNDARKSVASYVDIFQSGGQTLDPHAAAFPTVKKAFNKILMPFFEEFYLPAQKLLENPKMEQVALNVLEPRYDIPLKVDLDKDVQAQWVKCGVDSVAKWNALKTCVSKARIPFGNPISDIVLTFTYPRIDANVSTSMQHLLKSPFCIHPSTGRVCVPVDPKKCEQFDPFTVPTLAGLVTELGSCTKEDLEAGNAMEKTKMAPFINTFLEFLQPLLADCSSATAQ